MKKGKKKDGAYIGVHLPTELYEAVAAAARENGRSLAAEMRTAAKKHVTAGQ